MGRIIITQYKNRIITCHFDDKGELESINACESSGAFMGRIYRGRVSRVIKNLNACFVNVSPKTACFLPFKEVVEDIPKEGDEITVMINRESVKTKGPSATMYLSITGRYMVLKPSDGYSLGISRKITDEGQKNRLRGMFDEIAGKSSLNIVVRTVASEAGESSIRNEFDRLSKVLSDIENHSCMRKVYSLLYGPKPGYVSFIDTLLRRGISEIVTDVPEVYDCISSEFSTDGMDSCGDAPAIKLYTDDTISLFNLHSMGRRLDELTHKKVYLKCGGYLVIEQTEALNVIDVNSGKYIEQKDRGKALKRVNMEAACEIARQLRLRNLSGMIIVDFINEEEDKAGELLEYLQLQLLNDEAKPQVVDMTALSLVEITRKCTTASLLQQLADINPV